jgi:hypothetical protein
LRALQAERHSQLSWLGAWESLEGEASLLLLKRSLDVHNGRVEIDVNKQPSAPATPLRRIPVARPVNAIA